METVTLNDGTVLNDSHVLESRGILWFYLRGVTFERAYELMVDDGRTERIVMNSYGSETVFTGYTDLFSLRREDDGMITGGLARLTQEGT